jgi:hypothetical protein
MSKKVGENQIHEVTVTMPYDLSGHTLEAQYVSLSDGSVTAGASATGSTEGVQVSFSTDLGAKSIDPGVYDLEVHYDDGGTDRQLQLEGDTVIYIQDANSI